MAVKLMETLVAFCKRRGFVFQGSDIYGGLKGTYDFGPLGVELKKNLRQAWWTTMVYERDDVEGIECTHISNKLIWKYSGHEDSFSDPLVECKDCHTRMREDKMVDKTKCDKCGSTNLTEPRPFHLMMKIDMGPVANDEDYAYLRAETAQGTYINFRNVMDSTSRKIPFGIAQHGQSFRNEITPRNFLFRTREFEQAEMQFFVEPGTDKEWFETWKNIRTDWWIKQGLSEKNLRFEPHSPDDLVFYAKPPTGDIEYKFPHGWDELEGIHNRTDYDLGTHTKNQKEFDIQATVKENTHSNTKLNYLDPQTGQNYIPFVIEVAAGLNRGIIAVLNEAYAEEDLGDGKSRIVLKLKKHLAPIKVAVVPLAKNNPELVALAKDVKNRLQKLGLGRILFENTGNVGKAYRRHDEVGTPLCLTIDFESLEEKPASLTVRDRDTMKQERIEIDQIETYVLNYFKGE
ncbi:MAG: glycine--tRNA ligase [Alphaproteobacteria bacterium]|nr:glycine--tRNA ligase [Alphaproteobacteria bacterium]MBN2779702.1 glycine--tRNA ligase [Alphaproteobacteria bacterium]